MIIIGSGEMAKLVRKYFGMGTPIVSPDSPIEIGQKVHTALSYRGMNKPRERLFNIFMERGNPFVSYISQHAVNMAEFVGDNAFILEHNVLQPGVTIGDNVMLWSGNHIGHDSFIDDHTYFASHVVLSGHCKVGKRCFFGVNASVKDFTTIGNDCFITMGAIVTKDMPDGSVAIDRDIITGEKAERIKMKYFGGGDAVD